MSEPCRDARRAAGRPPRASAAEVRHGPARRSQRHPRIDGGGQDVGEEVDQHRRAGEDHGDPLHHHVVAREDADRTSSWPMPGMANTVSITTVPPISQPMLTARRLIVGTREFGSTCRQNIEPSGRPRARAAMAWSDEAPRSCRRAGSGSAPPRARAPPSSRAAPCACSLSPKVVAVARRPGKTPSFTLNRMISMMPSQKGGKPSPHVEMRRIA